MQLERHARRLIWHAVLLRLPLLLLRPQRQRHHGLLRAAPPALLAVGALHAGMVGGRGRQSGTSVLTLHGQSRCWVGARRAAASCRCPAQPKVTSDRKLGLLMMPLRAATLASCCGTHSGCSMLLRLLLLADRKDGLSCATSPLPSPASQARAGGGWCRGAACGCWSGLLLSPWDSSSRKGCSSLFPIPPRCAACWRSGECRAEARWPAQPANRLPPPLPCGSMEAGHSPRRRRSSTLPKPPSGWLLIHAQSSESGRLPRRVCRTVRPLTGMTSVAGRERGVSASPSTTGKLLACDSGPPNAACSLHATAAAMSASSAPSSWPASTMWRKPRASARRRVSMAWN